MPSIFHAVTLSLGSVLRLHRPLPAIPRRAWGGDRHRETRYSVEMTYRPLYKPLTDQERAEIRARIDQQVRETEAVEAHYIIQRRPMKNGVRMQYATCPNCGTAFHWPGGFERYNREKAFADMAECIGRTPAATAVKCEAEEGLGPRAMATPLNLKRAPIGDNHDNYDVLEKGVVVGRIFKAQVAPQDRPWMW